MDNLKFYYSKRVWLNEDHLPSTGSVAAYHGDIGYPDGVDKAVGFLEISDCHNKVRLHLTPSDSMKQFIVKMEKLRGVIDEFVGHLKEFSIEAEKLK